MGIGLFSKAMFAGWGDQQWYLQNGIKIGDIKKKKIIQGSFKSAATVVLINRAYQNFKKIH